MPHYFKIDDGNGGRAKLVARRLIRLSCTDKACNSRIWVDWADNTDPTTVGLPSHCFHCGCPLLREWGEGQLAFLPETEYHFPGEPVSGDQITIEYRATEDLPSNWADQFTNDVGPTDPTGEDE